MAAGAKAKPANPGHKEHPFDHLRATPEQRARLLAAAQPFDVAAWQRGSVSPTPEELADLDNFLQELEEMRRRGIQHQDERLAELEG